MSDEECKHPDGYTRTRYEGDTLLGASGYCRDCDTGWTLNMETKKMEFKSFAKKETQDGPTDAGQPSA